MSAIRAERRALSAVQVEGDDEEEVILKTVLAEGEGCGLIDIGGGGSEGDDDGDEGDDVVLV